MVCNYCRCVTNKLMEGSRRKHVFDCQEDFLLWKYSAFIHNRTQKPRVGTVLTEVTRKSFKRERELNTCSVSANKILALWRTCVRITIPVLRKHQLFRSTNNSTCVLSDVFTPHQFACSRYASTRQFPPTSRYISTRIHGVTSWRI